MASVFSNHCDSLGICYCRTLCTVCHGRHKTSAFSAVCNYCNCCCIFLESRHRAWITLLDILIFAVVLIVDTRILGVVLFAWNINKEIRRNAGKRTMNLKYIMALMLMLHIFLYVWKALIPFAFSLSQPFEMKMVTMAGMCILTVVVIFISRTKKTSLAVCPRQFDAPTITVLLLSTLMLVSTAVLFTKGSHGFWLLLYGSIVTPLFEELLFRGHIYDIQQHIHRSMLSVVVINALLFSIWHLGYIVNPLLCGEWMALGKLVAGLLYGLVLAYIRFRTKSTLCCILLHGAINGCAN